MKKRAQIKMSFGMIFSIILIVVFIAFAFYGIGKFLNLSKSMQIGKFTNDFQYDVENLWKSDKGSQEVEYSLPSTIKEVCFVNEDYENMIFESDEFIEGKKINYIDLDKSIVNENSLCITNTKGKIKMIIKKDYGDNLVTIKEQ